MEPAQLSQQTIGRDEWVKLVARFSVDNPEIRPRRGEVRRDLTSAFARICYHDEGPPPSWIERSCAVLQISSDGLMLRSHQPVPLHARVTLEVILDEAAVCVVGVVRHCTLGVGAFKVGIELKFT